MWINENRAARVLGEHDLDGLFVADTKRVVPRPGVSVQEVHPDLLTVVVEDVDLVRVVVVVTG